MPTIITFLETVKKYIRMDIASPGDLEIQSPPLAHISFLSRSLSLYIYIYKTKYVYMLHFSGAHIFFLI